MCTNPMYRCIDFNDKVHIVKAKDVCHYLKVSKIDNIITYFKGRFKSYDMFPCGCCLDCKKKKARDWSTRMELEFQSNGKIGAFITLTYDNEKLDVYNDLVEYPLRGISIIQQDFQKFMKRLRKKIGEKVTYYCCAEYGGKTKRPHFHLILYGYNFPEKKLLSKSKSGFPMYIDDLLTDTWKFGFHTIQDVTPATCQYVAKYVLKKKYGVSDDSQYHRNINGLDIKVCKEKSFMSKSVPIGYTYFQKYYEQLVSNDFVCVGIDKQKRGLPKVFMDWIKKTCQKTYDMLYLKHIQKIKYIFDEVLLDMREQYLYIQSLKYEPSII